MKITKYGHCCLLIKHKGVTLITDPGGFSELPQEIPEVDIILITHEHQDHLHIESLKKIFAKNPNAQLVSNSSVGKILDTEGIAYTRIEDGEHMQLSEILIEGFGKEHAEIIDTFGQVMNTGYFFDNTFFYPGDAFTDPGKHVEILALPTAGPWMKIKDAILYLRKLAPKKAFPVHDAVLSDLGKKLHNTIVGNLKPEGTEYIVLEYGKEIEM